MRQPKVWQRAPAKPVNPAEAEKRRIVAACEALICDVLKPKFLPVIIPTQFNYPIDIGGDWRAGRYRFLVRFRSGFEDNRGEEFDSPWARLDHMGPDSFDIHWMRHTGQWWPLDRGVTFAEALRLITEDGVLRPPI